MDTEAFTIRSDSKKVKQLDKLASQMDRSRNYLVNQAIDQLLEIHAWQIERTKEGIKAADEGRFASDTEMERIFNKYEDKLIVRIIWTEPAARALESIQDYIARDNRRCCIGSGTEDTARRQPA